MNSPPSPSPAAPLARTPWWCALVIVAASVVAYHNSFDGPFVFDDASSIVTNPTIRRLWPLTEPLTPPSSNVTAQGRPVLNLSLALNYAIGGPAVRGYHVVNLLIHASAALVLFGVVRRTWARVASAGATQATGLALSVAVLWAVHPLQTESVTYVIQRAESLMGLFYLLTLYGFIRAATGEAASSRREKTVRWSILSVVACAAGMATKEVTATAPLMVLFYDRCFVAGTFLGALRRRPGFYAALGGTWLLLAWLIHQTGGNRGGSVGFGVGVAWWDYWLTQFAAIGAYLKLTFWPHPLVFEYGSFWIEHAGRIAVEILLVLGLVGGTLVALARRPAWGFLGAWFLGILAPTSLAPGTTQMIVEHRMYLPLAAVWVAAVGLAQALVLARRRSLAVGFAVAVVLAAMLLTIRRNADYRSDLVLWTDTIAKRPGNPLAHFMLAGAWERAGDPARASVAYEETLRLKPDFSVGQETYGELLLRLGRRAEAIPRFEAALRLQPEFADAHMNLGNALLAEGRGSDALTHLAEAVRLMPQAAEAHYNFGHALAAAGRVDEAEREFAATLQRPAGSPAVHVAAHLRLANLLAMSGRPAGAVPHYEEVLRARPDDAEAQHNLGSAFFQLGRRAEAVRHYEEALRLAPDFPGARENLARARTTPD